MRENSASLALVEACVTLALSNYPSWRAKHSYFMRTLQEAEEELRGGIWTEFDDKTLNHQRIRTPAVAKDNPHGFPRPKCK
jgi:hypothetical protein